MCTRTLPVGAAKALFHPGIAEATVAEKGEALAEAQVQAVPGNAAAKETATVEEVEAAAVEREAAEAKGADARGIVN